MSNHLRELNKCTVAIIEFWIQFDTLVIVWKQYFFSLKSLINFHDFLIERIQFSQYSIIYCKYYFIFVVVDCGNPEEVDNGQLMLPSNATYYGVLALYSCNENFELHGVSRRLCQENGTWSSTLPQCKGKLTDCNRCA